MISSSKWRLSASTGAALLMFSSLAMAADTAAKPVTFAKDIAPIFQEKCQDCHRNGSMAPMSLVTYEETRPWAKSIRQRVVTRQMPPWHIDKTVGVQKFENDCSLSDEQIATIVPLGRCRRAAGRSQGHACAQSSGPPRTTGKLRKSFGPAGHGDQVGRLHDGGASSGCLVAPRIEVPVTEPRWVRAVEIRPGTAAGRKITHHAVAYLVQNDLASIRSGDHANDRPASG